MKFVPPSKRTETKTYPLFQRYHRLQLSGNTTKSNIVELTFKHDKIGRQTYHVSASNITCLYPGLSLTTSKMDVEVFQQVDADLISLVLQVDADLMVNVA